MFPTKDNFEIDWRTASWRRNGILGRLVYAERSCGIAINSDLIDSADRLILLTIRKALKSLLIDWDRHYIKKLRQDIESRQKRRN